MKLLFAILVLVLTCQIALCQSVNPQDPYGEKLLNAMFTKTGGVMITSSAAKEICRLGDRASVALIRRIAVQEPVTEHEVRSMLEVVRTAFEFPGAIQFEDDRQPRATSFLLAYLEKLPASSGLKGEIQNVRADVDQQLNAYELKQHH